MVEDTVHDRLRSARTELTATQIAAGLAIAVALGVTLAALQDPLAHDSLHTFRHGAGITCH